MARHEDGRIAATDYVVLALTVAMLAWFGLHGTDAIHALTASDGETETHAAPGR